MNKLIEILGFVLMGMILIALILLVFWGCTAILHQISGLM